MYLRRAAGAAAGRTAPARRPTFLILKMKLYKTNSNSYVFSII